MKQQLTVKEALEQGYRYYGYGSSNLQEIEDICEDDDFPHGSLLYAAVGEPILTITKKELSELLAGWAYEHVGNKVEDESMAEKAYQIFLKMDLQMPANYINRHFEDDLVYNQTDIELIP